MSTFVGANLTRTWTAAQLRDGSAPAVGSYYHAKNGKKYRFVLFDNGAGNVAAVAGKAAYLFGTSAASTGATDTVTMDLTDAVGAYGVVAGVFQSAPADGEYCWIQCWGVCTLATTLATGADGELLAGALTAGTDGTMRHLEISGSGAGISDTCGYIIDASAKIVFLRCS